MKEDGFLYLDTLVIQADSELGYHIYYKDYGKEFSFMTMSENIKDIVEIIIDYLKH